jgi:isoleucyl-tRNA synthetase
LSVSDRIRLTIDAPDSVTEAARTHEGLIRSETLALDVGYSQANDGVAGKVGDGLDVRVGIVKVADHAHHHQP